MRGIATDILERRQIIQSELDSLNVRRDVLEKRLAALDTLLEMEQEVKQETNGAPQEVAGPTDNGARRNRVPLTPKIDKVLEEHPDWELLPRNEQMQRISEQLLLEGHDFIGKDPFLSVGFALTQRSKQGEWKRGKAAKKTEAA